MRMSYPVHVLSRQALIQQVAVALVPHGYFHFIHTTIPMNKNPLLVDAKIFEQYGTDRSPDVQRRLHKEGIAKVRYLRYRHHMVLAATDGIHAVHQEERLVDIRKEPFHLFGYAVMLTNGRVSVRLEARVYGALRRHVFAHAASRANHYWSQWLWNLPYQPFSGVKLQTKKLHKLLNRERTMAGYSKIDKKNLRQKRKQIKVFLY